MPTRTDGSQSILYLPVRSPTPESGPNAKDDLAVELLEDGSDLSDARPDRSVIMPVQTQIKTDIDRNCSTQIPSEIYTLLSLGVASES